MVELVGATEKDRKLISEALKYIVSSMNTSDIERTKDGVASSIAITLKRKARTHSITAADVKNTQLYRLATICNEASDAKEFLEYVKMEFPAYKNRPRKLLEIKGFPWKTKFPLASLDEITPKRVKRGEGLHARASRALKENEELRAEILKLRGMLQGGTMEDLPDEASRGKAFVLYKLCQMVESKLGSDYKVSITF